MVRKPRLLASDRWAFSLAQIADQGRHVERSGPARPGEKHARHELSLLAASQQRLHEVTAERFVSGAEGPPSSQAEHAAVSMHSGTGRGPSAR